MFLRDGGAVGGGWWVVGWGVGKGGEGGEVGMGWDGV